MLEEKRSEKKSQNSEKRSLIATEIESKKKFAGEMLSSSSNSESDEEKEEVKIDLHKNKNSGVK